MATHSSTLAWKISWTKEPGGLQSMGSRRVGQDWATSLSLFTFMHWRGNGNPLQCSCLENPRDGGAWWAAIYGVAQSRTQLKWLSSSSRLSVTPFIDHVFGGVSPKASAFYPGLPSRSEIWLQFLSYFIKCIYSLMCWKNFAIEKQRLFVAS